MKSQRLADSFGYALEGLVHVLRVHRHVRYQLALVVLALLLSLVLRVPKLELMLLFFAIGLVLLAEIVNTAVETVVDLVTEHYHPLAKRAKDIAGAAVLVASFTAALIGVLVFLDQAKLRRLLAPGARIHPDVLHVVLVGMALAALVVVMAKARVPRGTLVKGGVVSGHSALAFLLFGAIWYLAANLLVGALALAMALLVSQSRVDAGVHSLREVALGGLIGLVVTLAVFRFLA